MEGLVQYIGYIFIFTSLYFEVFLLISFLEKKPQKKALGNFPKVSIIVPCFNEEATIENTLLSILGLDYPAKKIEIIVVNDGSTDNTLSILKKFESNPLIKIYNKENGGKYTALNFGIGKATSDFIGCLDADSFVDKDALKKIMAHFNKKEVMAVTPSMVIHNPNNILRSMQKAEYYYGNFVRKALALIGAIHITPGPFSFFRKKVFETIGLYKHAHNTEDMEMAMRMQKHRMTIENEPEALVFTVGPSNVKKLYKQRERWVSGFLGNIIDYRYMMFDKKYGDLGMLILPFASFAIIMTMVYLSFSLFRFGKIILNKIEELKILGLPNFELGHFELFYMNTSTVSILAIFLMLLTFFLVMFGQKIVLGKWKIPLESFYFLFLYSFLAPFWLTKAIYNNVRAKDASWR